MNASPLVILIARIVVVFLIVYGLLAFAVSPLFTFIFDAKADFSQYVAFWFVCSLILLSAGVFLFVRTKRAWVAYIAIYFISQPFSWTLLWGASMGGGFALPAPDIFSIIGLFAGQFQSGRYSGAGSIPPPFIASAVVYAVAFFLLARHRKDIFKASDRGCIDAPPPEKW